MGKQWGRSFCFLFCRLP